jgi:hypothetical protein
MFLSRLAKGPPLQYRWLAWKFIGYKLLKKEPGEYNELLALGRQPENKTNINQISKDVDRTFPDLPFFSIEAQGEYGQAIIQNILEAYSVKVPDVGYCQSMNFMVAFVLVISGGNEKESFWFFTAILERSHEQIPFDGLRGFYESDFPLLHQYMSVFNALFKEWLPELWGHFDQQGVPDQIWIQKWFMTCFLYSFPYGLCIRIWDNILAFGTRFIFNVSLSLLSLLRDQLIELDFGEINEFFKSLKDDSHLEEKLLPPTEQIIEGAQRIYITDEKITELFDKYAPIPKVIRPLPNIAKKI